MPNDAARFDAMLFDYKTTTNNDFKPLKFEPIVKSSFREKKRVTRAPYKNEKYIHTLIEWNGPKVPFDLLWGLPKDVVRTDPRKVQQPFHSKPEDLGRMEAQRTRPRLVMTPSISLDDIEDDDQRKMLTEDIYRSCAQIAMREGIALTMNKNKNVRAPLPGRNARAHPVFLGCALPSRVPPEWRRDTISWDSRQLRTHTEPEREFWLRFGSLYKDCGACKVTAQIKKTRDMAKKLLPN